MRVMPHETPAWWNERRGWRQAALAPASALYGAAVKARFAHAKPYRSRLPVICVGNFTMGGAGKTPLAIALARMLIARGERPAFLTRGYGGREAGPIWVEPRRRADEVGDEPLLLARHAPVMVARARPNGARAIEASAATVIIMDDGFQNPSLQKDLTFVAVDGGFGMGNGLVFPSGPLRAPLAFQTRMADAVVQVGGPEGAVRLGAHPVLYARVAAVNAEWLKGVAVLAFCGIGRPEKFFATVREAGAQIVEAIPFADHHAYREEDAARLLKIARGAGAALVTTEKDYVRLSADAGGALGELRAAARPLAIELLFSAETEDKINNFLTSALKR
jgi:tetraacyldisaccharide 4'-kinase